MSIVIPLNCLKNVNCPSFETICVSSQKIVGVLFRIPLLPLSLLNALGQYFQIDFFAWQQHLFTPISPFPKEFLEELERSNREKPDDAPLALVLHAETDQNHAFFSHASWHIFLQIAKTHRVALKTIDTGWFWSRRIQETALEEGRSIDLLYVAAHGQANGMQFGEFGFWNIHPSFSISDISPSDFASFSKNAVLILDSCDTGKSLAREMAIVSKRIVLAPKKEIDAVMSVYLNPHLLVYEDGKQLMHAFFPDGSSHAIEGDAEACRKLFQEKHDYVRQAAESGDALAQAALARIFRLGVMVDQSDSEALHWYRLAAEQGNAQSQYMMGTFYEKGLGGLSQSDEEALYWYELAAAQGHKRACCMLGIFYSEGRGKVAVSNQKALSWLRRSAEKGDSLAQFKMGQAYFNGSFGLKISTKEAFRWFSFAAEGGLVSSEYVVGLLYKTGYESLEKSSEKALFWFRRAAEQGSPEAAYEVGLAYQRGWGVDKSEIEAVRWFRLAAEKGNADAQNKLGVFYHWGWGGLSQSFSDALHWYRLAVEQGNELAEFNLGFLYEHGLGGLEPSDEKALHLYRRSAEQGSSIAAWMMGRFYEQGRGGLAPSAEMAKEWFEKIPEPEREEIRLEVEGLREALKKEARDVNPWPLDREKAAGS